MKYCKYCGRQLADDQLCDCEDAKAERNEVAGSSDDTQRVEKEVLSLVQQLKKPPLIKKLRRKQKKS